MPPINGFLGLFTIFFSYFASLDVLLSVWLFDLVFILEGGWLNRIGMTAISPYYYRGVTYWQTKGAFVVLVASVFWVARGHLGGVARRALKRDPSVDDRDELVSYRGSLVGFVVGLVVMWLWLVRAGFEPVYGILLLASVIFTYVGMAKVIADTGLPYTNVPAGPWGLVAPFLGGQAIGAETRVALRFSSRVTSHFKGLFLPSLIHVGKISDGLAGQRRKLMASVGAAFLVSLLVSCFLMLKTGYEQGAYNFAGWEITQAGPRHFAGTAKSVKDFLKGKAGQPVYSENPEHVGFFALGSVAMAALIYLRHRFVWWPLHPVGLAISGSYLTRRTSFTVFIAWLIKVVMLRVGGPSIYRKSRPLFVGLLVGYILGVALSAGIDAVWFPERGHYVHRY